MPGKELFSCGICKGNEIVSIQPFFIEQTVDNKLIVQCCAYCSKYLNSKQYFNSSVKECNCELGCKEVYCSEQCKSDDLQINGHWMNCTGRTNGRASRLTSEFVNHSKLNNSLFMSAFKIISKMVAVSLENARHGKSFSTELRQSSNNFSAMFPTQILTQKDNSDPVIDCGAIDDETNNIDDTVSDSYFMLLALMRYECHPPVTTPPLSSLSSEVFTSALCDVFTLSVYQSIVAAVTTHLVPVRLEQPLHPLLAEVKRIPLMHKYSDRLQAVNKFREEAYRATSFLTPNKGTAVVPLDLQTEQRQDSESIATRTIIETERLAARLSQAADLASTATGEEDYNPFSGMCFVGMALVPQAVFSSGRGESRKEHDHDDSSNDLQQRFRHSCMPNVHLEAVSTSSSASTARCGLSIRAIALRHIYPHEELSYCYIDTSATHNVKERQTALNKKSEECCFSEFTADDYQCDCERCTHEVEEESHNNSLLSSHLTTRDVASLSALVSQYCSYNISTTSPSLQSVLSSSVTQCLLLEVLALQTRTVCDVRSVSDQQSTEALFKRLVTARSLADMYMQEGNLCDSVTLYCAIVLAFSAQSVQTVCEYTDDLIALVGDVMLSIGNALLDASLSLASQSNNSINPPSDGLVSLSSVDDLLSTPQAIRIAEMLTSAPWQLCHRVWRLGTELLGNKHTGLVDSCSKLNSYVYCKESDVAQSAFTFDPQYYYTVSTFSQPPPAATKSQGQALSSSPSIYLSKQPLLSSEECQQAIALAEQHAAQSTTGWTTARHYAVPTTDIPIHASSALLAWFNGIMKDRLGAMLMGQFISQNVSVEDIGRVVVVHDAFIVKYQCDEEDGEDMSGDSAQTSSKQRYLPLHSDQSTHSLTVALNDRGEYEGGGTYFAALDTAIRPDRGHVLSFRGELLHGGDPIISGTRYILAIFLLLQTDKPELVRTSELRENKKRKGDECSGGLATLFRDRTSALNKVSTSKSEVLVDEREPEQGLFSFAFKTETTVVENVDSGFSFGFGFE